MRLQNNLDEEEAPLPVKLQKISGKLAELTARVSEYKKEATQIHSEMKTLEKMFDKYAAKIAKDHTKAHSDQRRRKPSGFASPTRVSPELCVFMGKQVGELVSRTETSKFLSKYINEHGLCHPQEKSVIVPDEPLSQLLGSDAIGNKITYFTIQKYMNRHFVKTAEESEGVLVLSQGI